MSANCIEASANSKTFSECQKGVILSILTRAQLSPSAPGWEQKKNANAFERELAHVCALLDSAHPVLRVNLDNHVPSWKLLIHSSPRCFSVSRSSYTPCMKRRPATEPSRSMILRTSLAFPSLKPRSPCFSQRAGHSANTKRVSAAGQGAQTVTCRTLAFNNSASTPRR